MEQREADEARPSKKGRKYNAVKNGAFSSIIELFPWEDGEEFEQLHRELVSHHEPSGPLQEDCIRDVARLMWQKRRVSQKRQLDTAAELERVQNQDLWREPGPLYNDCR